MEPRLRRRGNGPWAHAAWGWTEELQWSPGLVAGETALRGTGYGQDSSFNGAPAWSPGEPETGFASPSRYRLASMEPRLGRRGNDGAERALVETHLASMEPRLGRRGNWGRLAAGGPGTSRFNGAPAWSPGEQDGPGVVSPPVELLQWSPGLVAGGTRRRRRRKPTAPCFNGAPAWSPGERPRRGEARPAKERFNGAPAWSPGEPLQPPTPPPRAATASMEPRLGRRGNPTSAALPSSVRTRFNGAPAWSPGEQPDLRMALQHDRGASMEPRLGRRGNGGGVSRAAETEALQWSPGLVAGGTHRRRALELEARVASMEPRLGRRGNPDGPEQALVGIVRFNGAPAWSPGEHRAGRRPRGEWERFNGAPAWSPGEQDTSTTPATLKTWLQWSPGLVAGGTWRVDLFHGVSDKRFNGAPAWSPGEPDYRPRRPGEPAPASMEPRLGRRGNVVACVGSVQSVTLLQWSPGLVAGGTR